MSEASSRRSGSRQRLIGEVKDYAFTIAVSGLIGGLVALAFCLWYRIPLMPGTVQGALAGVCIGVVSHTGFVLVQKRLGSRPFWAFAFIFLVIGAGTLAGALLFGFHGALPIALLLAAAEAAGMTVTFLKYRYGILLNDRLCRLQRRIQTESEKNPQS